VVKLLNILILKILYPNNESGTNPFKPILSLILLCLYIIKLENNNIANATIAMIDVINTYEYAKLRSLFLCFQTSAYIPVAEEVILPKKDINEKSIIGNLTLNNPAYTLLTLGSVGFAAIQLIQSLIVRELPSIVTIVFAGT
jgi:hypothetical protein